MVAMMLAVSAWAGPALDYVAPAACPEAGRFSDEVSAQIGAQAFGGGTGQMVIRLAEAGSEIVGTLEYAGGSRMVRGATCAQAFEELVVAAATALGASPVPAAQPATPSGLEMVKVTMETTKPGVTVARITGRGTAVGAGGTASAVFYEDLCIAPCSFELPRGFHEIGTYGKGTRGLTEKIQLEEPETLLRSRPTSIWTLVGGSLLGAVGTTLLVTGSVFYAMPGCSDYDAWSSASTLATTIPKDPQCVAQKRRTAGAVAAGGLVGVGVSVPLLLGGGKIERVP